MQSNKMLYPCDAMQKIILFYTRWLESRECMLLRDEKDDFIDPSEAEQVEIVLYKVF